MVNRYSETDLVTSSKPYLSILGNQSPTPNKLICLPSLFGPSRLVQPPPSRLVDFLPLRFGPVYPFPPPPLPCHNCHVYTFASYYYFSTHFTPVLHCFWPNFNPWRPLGFTYSSASPTGNFQTGSTTTDANDSSTNGDQRTTVRHNDGLAYCQLALSLSYIFCFAISKEEIQCAKTVRMLSIPVMSRLHLCR